MTVIDTSALVDYVTAEGAFTEIERILRVAPSLEAPDVVVFEVLATLRRRVRRGVVRAGRAEAALDDLGEIRMELYPSMALRARAWELRDNLGAADALFVALAEELRQPLVTRDAGLAKAARAHTAVEAIEVG